MARVLRGTDVEALDEEMGRRAGLLLGATSASDVVDAAVVLLARDGDRILTSDTDDLVPLAMAAGLQVDVVPV